MSSSDDDILKMLAKGGKAANTSASSTTTTDSSNSRTTRTEDQEENVRATSKDLDEEEDPDLFIMKIVAERSRSALSTNSSSGNLKLGDDDEQDDVAVVEKLSGNGDATMDASEATRKAAARPTHLKPQESVPGAHAVEGPGRMEASANHSNQGHPVPLTLEPSAEFARRSLDSSSRSVSVISQTSDHLSPMIQDAFLAEIVQDPVDLEEARDLPVAEIAPEHPATKADDTTRNRCLSLFVLLMVAIGVGVPLGTLLRRNGQNETILHPTTRHNETDTTTLVLHPPFAEGLPPEYSKGIQIIDSSYYWANLWMLQDPNLQTYSPKRQKQRFALAYFYYQTKGHNWYRNDDWLSYQVDECHWFQHNSSVQIGGWQPGMEVEPICDDDQGLLALNLSSNNLQGSSPVLRDGGFVDANFRIFDVANNAIEGSMPTVTTEARGMQVFSMANNKLEGHILGGGGMSAFNVRIVQLNGNQLLGYFPQLCLIFPALEVLDVSDNVFDVGVPPELYRCKNLTHYIGRRNRYEGNIPSELGLVSNLRRLDVSGNTMMEGALPTELGLLSNLEFLGVEDTGLVGQIPPSLCSRNDDEKPPLQVVGNCSLLQCCQ